MFLYSKIQKTINALKTLIHNKIKPFLLPRVIFTIKRNDLPHLFNHEKI